MIKHKIFKLTPFIVLVLIVINAWHAIFSENDVITYEHYLALAVLAINLFLYLVKFKIGLLLTGLVLCLGTFGVLLFYPIKILSYEGIVIGKILIRTPFMNMNIFLLLIYYFVVNGGYILNLYHESRNKSSR